MEEPHFSFQVSYESPQNATNVAGWLHRPAGKHGFIRAEAGRLVTDAGPMRFWATNLCFDGCFPSRAQAERLAERLARLGFNAVRMHHMDNRSIWGESPDKLTIDPQRMDRLDYLIHQLKERGIYTNLNLHVSRTLGPAEGFPVDGNRPRNDKAVTLFEPRMIELQKKIPASSAGTSPRRGAASSPWTAPGPSSSPASSAAARSTWARRRSPSARRGSTGRPSR